MTSRIKMAGLIVLALISVNSSAWAKDYRTMSTDELSNLRGTMQSATQKERDTFNKEWIGRVEQMTPAERQDYAGSGKRMGNSERSERNDRMSSNSGSDRRGTHNGNDVVHNSGGGSGASSGDDSGAGHNGNDGASSGGGSGASSGGDSGAGHSGNDSASSGGGSGASSGSDSGAGHSGNDGASSGGGSGSGSGGDSGGGHNGNDGGEGGSHD